MSEWQSVLKSTSIEKQTSNEAMDKFIEGLGKVMQEYEKERVTNQPTTATQPTQPTQPLALQQQATTGYRGSPQQRKPMSGSTPKVATGFKALSQQEVEAMKGFGYTDKHIKELDKQRLKQYGEAPPELTMGQRAGQVATQAGQRVKQATQQLPQWMKNLRNKPAGQNVGRATVGDTVRVGHEGGGFYDKGKGDPRTTGFGVSPPPKPSIPRKITDEERVAAQRGELPLPLGTDEERFKT